MRFHDTFQTLILEPRFTILVLTFTKFVSDNLVSFIKKFHPKLILCLPEKNLDSFDIHFFIMLLVIECLYH